MDQDLPEALRLADRLDSNVGDTRKFAAAELRRQHAEIEALKKALRLEVEKVCGLGHQTAEVCAPSDLDGLRPFLLGWQTSEACQRNEMTGRVDTWLTGLAKMQAALRNGSKT